MIKTLTLEGPRGHPLVSLGLSHENLDRLKDGKPIHITSEQCEVLGLGSSEIIIFAGATEITMTEELVTYGLIPEEAAKALVAEHKERGG